MSNVIRLPMSEEISCLTESQRKIILGSFKATGIIPRAVVHRMLEKNCENPSLEQALKVRHQNQRQQERSDG